MQEIKLIDLQEIALPNWLPNNYIQAIADAIESTGFVPPILCLDDELLTPDVVAALVTIKARGKIVPLGVAVLDGRWLVKVDRRVSKTTVKVEHETVHHYHDDWYRHIRPITVWRDAYWTYNSSFSTGGLGGVSLTAKAQNALSWNADNPLVPSFSVSGNTVMGTLANATVTR